MRLAAGLLKTLIRYGFLERDYIVALLNQLSLEVERDGLKKEKGYMKDGEREAAK